MNHSPEAEQIRKLERNIELLSKGIKAVRSLIDESEGVYGLHRNGAHAEWSELEKGGEFEPWLIDFNNAEMVINPQPAADPTNSPYDPEAAQTCPRRMNGLGPWERKENLDRWEQRGPNRCCSFCGSIHPDDFEKIVDKCLAGEKGYSIDQTTKQYKFFVRQPKIENATQGGIKYYTAHTPDDKEWIRCVEIKLQKALLKQVIAWKEKTI